MKIGIQAIHFTANQKLMTFIQKKVNKLDHFYDQIISGEVYLKLDDISAETNKTTEIKLTIPGSILFAKGECKSFEEATDLCIECLRRQITKHKDKVRLNESKHKGLVN